MMAATKDSIFAHCVARAVIADQGGIEAATAKYGPKAERLSKWTALKTAARVMPKASRVSTFVVLWALAMRDEKTDGFSITEYQRYWNESERQAYRSQKEFRELWPEFETPNELAVQIVKYVNARVSKKDAGSLPLTLQVVA
jgi:outer membrane cobalamin receptor